jgi:hypothetical protein
MYRAGCPKPEENISTIEQNVITFIQKLHKKSRLFQFALFLFKRAKFIRVLFRLVKFKFWQLRLTNEIIYHQTKRFEEYSKFQSWKSLKRRRKQNLCFLLNPECKQ